MANKLPNEIYVVWEEPKEDDPLLLADTSYLHFMWDNQTRPAGLYRLVKEIEIVNTTALINKKEVKHGD